MRIVPPLVHAVLDYPIALLLLALPNVAGVFHVDGPIVIVPRAIGVAILVYSLLTRYDLAAFRMLPMRVHVALDIVAASLLAASPFVFGFWRLEPRAWVPHILAGSVILALALVTDTASRRVSI